MPRPDPSSRTSLAPLVRFVAFLLLAVVTLYLCFKGRPSLVTGEDELGVSLTSLPKTALGWRSEAQTTSEKVREILSDDTQFANRAYFTGDGYQFDLSIVLSGENRHDIHKPEICLPAQGFIPNGSTVRTVELANGETLRVMDLDLTKNHLDPNDETKSFEVRYHYMYWFVGGDITTPYHHQRIAYGALDSVIAGINHRWAYTSVMTPVPRSYRTKGRDNEETVALMEKFIAEVAPQFQESFTHKRSWSRWVPGL